MATMVENARGAANFTVEDRKVQQFVDSGAAVYTHQTLDPEWDACIAQIKQFRSYEEDWDGEGSLPPGPELVDAAISHAQWLQCNNEIAPDRVVVSVNGTIFFEWYELDGYYEHELVSPSEFEERGVPSQSGFNISARIGSSF